MWAFVKRHVADRLRDPRRSPTCCCRSRSSIVFSFNDPQGRFNYTWQGFTLDNWRNWDAVPGLRERDRASLEIAADREHRRDGARDADRARARPLRLPRPRATNLPHLPADGDAGDRARRLAADALPRPATLVLPASGRSSIAHVMFCISYVVVTVKARLVGFDRHLEEAAMDLGANEWTTFRKVTLPLIAPAILAALRCSRSRSRSTTSSITYFNAGADGHVPALRLGRGSSRRAAAGERDRHGDLRRRRLR